MNRSIIPIILAIPCALSVMAEDAVPDSIQIEELHEIVIEAPKVIRKSDMEVYYPSKSALNNSKNGLQLLNNIMIPALSVSDVMGTIQASGQAVQVRINGRPSTVEQVRSLLPETIKRVEWIDNPGLRYGGANYVLNFIVINPAVGGSLMVNARQALNQKWGYDMVDAKFNNGPSQWAVGAYIKPTDNLKTHREFSETIEFPDGNNLTREESPLGGRLDNTQGSAWASYSYIKPDTTVFMAEFGISHKFSDRFLYNGLLSLSNGENDILLTDSHGDKGSTPALSLYWQQNFARRQMLVMNFSSSFYFGRTYSEYAERYPGASDFLNDIYTNIKDRNQAYAIEADYIKSWNNGRLTAGASYTANRNRSQYENLNNEIFHQRQDKAYFFAEYFHRFGKWTATAGMGAQYTNFLFRETGEGNHTWSPRPQATITYSLNQNHNFRLNFSSWQSTPSLTETNVVPQQIDDLQWRVGNQDLKTASSYMLFFSYGFNLPRVNGSFGIRAFTSPDAITPILYWESDRLITSYENSDGLQNISFYLAPQIEIIPSWLTASGYLQFRTERMRGTGYTLTNSAWSGYASIQLNHWGFTLTGQYVRAQRDLWGEKISWGEDLSLIDLSYNWKSWQFSAGMIMPFGKYDQGSRTLSRWIHSEQHSRLDMRMPYLQISYNLQWGRQKRSANKLVDIDASTDRSTAGGR